MRFNFEARYYRSGVITDSTREVWFVLHGYGQLARFFIRKFATLNDRNICVIAPEGLSRFYLEQPTPRGRTDNRVGATWMTRENRETDILNYINYLDAVYAAEVRDRPVSVTVLGFSQGAATASRWLANNAIRCQRLILWSGIFPSDMPLDTVAPALKETEVLFVYGTNDAYFSGSRLDEMKQLAKTYGVQYRTIQFEGVHDIDESTLKSLT